MLIAIGVGLIVALTIATGYFVAQEFAYVAVDRSSLRNRAEKGDVAAKRALSATDRLSFVLSGAQLGITLTAILVGYLAEPYFGKGLESIFEDAGASKTVSAAIATVATMFVATVIQMVFGELAPKNWAIAEAETLACALSRSTLLYLKVAGPIIRIFDAAATKLLRSAGIEPVEELAGAATPEDLQHIIAESGDQGLLDAGTSLLLQRGLDFHDLTVRSAMIPRIDVVTVNTNDATSTIVDLLETGHTRFPVLGDNTDDLRGTIGITDLIDIEPSKRSSTPISALLNEAFIIPESIPLTSALEQMRNEHHQFACVSDEHGSFCGVLTLEDIAEELVGEIQDEDDPPEPTATQQLDGSWTLPARWRLDQLDETTGIELPENDDYETISGVILAALGRLPDIGDQVIVKQLLPPALSEDKPRHAIIKVLSVEHNVANTVNIRSEAIDEDQS